MSATALLEEEGSRSVEDALSGHVCRCGSYDQIVRAVERTVAGSD
jgi:aerobic-type carbon monoxide dehydrogenase small subunit (CoxS/CutS family)